MQMGEGVNVALPSTKKKKAKVKPTITAKWTRSEVRPDHNGRTFPPSSPPTDRIQNNAKARMRVITTRVPSGTSAKITVYHCHTGAKVKDGELTGLKVRANQVVDPATGRLPFFVFEYKHMPWDPWDKPFYYFKVEVDHEGLKFETPKDYKAKPKKVMRVRYWHVCVSDAIADAHPTNPLTTQAEMREIARILRNKKNHSVYTHAFNTANVPVSHWGSAMRNSYVYHHAGHGEIYDASGNAYPGPEDLPIPTSGTWNSKVIFGSTKFGATEVNQAGNVPSVPRYLVYIDTCVAGWETGLGKAFTGRGTQSYIAFRMYIPDLDARAMARKFYKKWAGPHRCDPDRIAQVFYDVGSPYYSSMRPILIGSGGGQISKYKVMNKIKSAVAGFVADVKTIFR